MDQEKTSSPTVSKSTSPTENSPPLTTPIKSSFSVIGISLCILTNIGLAANAIIVKTLSMPSIQKNFGRTSVQYFAILPLISYFNYSKESFQFFGSSPYTFKLMLTRAFIGNICSMCVYYAVSMLPVGDAVALTFFSTILTGIIGHFWLKEPFTNLDRACAFLSLCGVILISKPNFLFGDTDNEAVNPNDRVQGTLAAIVAAFLIATIIILVRKLAHLNPTVTIFYFSFFGIIMTSSASWIIYGEFYIPCKGELHLSVVHGLLGLFCQYCQSVALRYERAVTFAVCRSLQIVIVFVFQIVVLKNSTNWFSVSGSSLIFVSALAIAMRKFFSELGKDKVEPSTTISDDVIVCS